MSNYFHQQELMDHFRNPLNKKTIANADFSAGQENPSCGDKVYIEGTILNGKIHDLGFSGSGCVISQATTSILIDECIGKSINDVLSLTETDIIDMIGFELGPVRLKCATLSLQVLKEGLTRFVKITTK